ncbi:MAG: hypothetical protein GTO31_13690, partial [Xanthomonadales bacterium]|nr:hypothetical protein [Xanthomonadales bacterium]
PAGIHNPHYRTYHYPWLQRLEKKKLQMYKSRPETAYWVDYVVSDSWLIGFDLEVPDGMGGWREYPVGPHGDVKRLHHSRVCVGYLDGHVESVREGDLPWWWRHWAEDEP